jgi:integrase
MADLSRKKLRDALPVRREPHWQCLARGCYLGFRAGAGTWIARFRDRAGKQHHHALAGIHENDFDEAKRQAEEWLVRMGAAGVRAARRTTVKQALEAYLADLVRHGRSDTATKTEDWYGWLVYTDILAGLPLDGLTQQDMLEWRDRLVSDTRKPRTLNRYVTAVVAGLNRALELGYVGNPRAWKLDRLSDDTEDEGAAVFLTPAQRKALLTAAEPHAADFLRTLELTGGRPHEIAKATVADFDGETLKLSHKKGRPPKLRIRYVVLDADGIAHCKGAAAGKHPAALLFPDKDGDAWKKSTWMDAVRDAIKRHNESVEPADQLPRGTRAYSMRHARISELLQRHGIDPLTVAKQTGTSLQQIEKIYYKFISSAMKEKLAAVRNA